MVAPTPAPGTRQETGNDSGDETSDGLGLKDTAIYWLGKIGLKKSPDTTPDGGRATPSAQSTPLPGDENGGLGAEIKDAITYWLGRFKGK